MLGSYADASLLAPGDATYVNIQGARVPWPVETITWFVIRGLEGEVVHTLSPEKAREQGLRLELRGNRVAVTHPGGSCTEYYLATLLKSPPEGTMIAFCEANPHRCQGRFKGEVGVLVVGVQDLRL